MSGGKAIIETAEVFVPLLGFSRYKGAYGGRGSGKSHFFAESVVERSAQYPGTRVLCAREVQKSLRESVKRLIEDKIEHLKAPGFRVLNDHIITPGKGIMLFQGMQDHTNESIKSLEGFDIAYVEEAQTISNRSLELLRPTIRKDPINGFPGSELWFSWNPRSANDPIDLFLRGEDVPSDSAVVKANYVDNPFFPEVLEEERKWDEVHNRDRYAHIWLGEYEPAAIGAIWERVNFHQNRREDPPDLERIVVSIDPAVSSEDGANEHGIMVVAKGADDRGYVLYDGTLKGNPKMWAERAVALFDWYEADCVVIEINQGGDMCESTLKSVRPTLPVHKVRATRGKHVRAEPISALYSMNRVSHIGTFNELEDQMCLMTAGGYEGNGSPDRVDAMVWGFTELFPALIQPKIDRGKIDPLNRRRATTPNNWMGA